MLIVYISTAIIAGVAVIITRILNANIAIEIGLLKGTLVNYIVGFSVSIVILMFSTDSIKTTLPLLQSIPWWIYTGGIMGIAVVSLSSYLTHKISSFYMTLLVFIGQIFGGLVIDYFVGTEISIGKIVGGALVMAGLIYNLNIDRNTKTIPQEA